MALVDTRGYQLMPDIPGALQAGTQLGVAASERERQKAIRGILASQQGQRVGVQEGDITTTKPAMSQEEMKRRVRAIDPVQAEALFKKMGLDDATKRAEFSSFAAQLQAMPFNQRAGFIQARVEKLKSEGRDSAETEKLLTVDEKTQNQALLGIQLADLSTKERLGIQAQKAKLVADRVGALDVKSSKILDDGTVITVLKNNKTTVTGPDGIELEGEARAKAIKDAQAYGVEVQQKRAKGREAGKGAGKIAITSFEAAGRVKENISDLKRGIDLIEKEGATTGYIQDFLPNMKAATRNFANLRRKLGLNVVASVTFGALSEGELKLAMDVALPKGMSEEATVKWLRDRIEAQEKLAANLEDASLYLADHSVAELIQRNRAMKKAAKEKEAKVKEAATPETAAPRFLGFE